MLTITQQQQQTQPNLAALHAKAHAALMYLPEAAPARQWLDAQQIVPAIWQRYQLGTLPEQPVPDHEHVVKPIITIPWIVGGQVKAMRGVFVQPAGQQTSILLGDGALDGLLYGGHALSDESSANKTLLVVDGELNTWAVQSASSGSRVDVLGVDAATTSLSARFYAKASQYRQCIFWSTNRPLLKEAGQQIEHAFQVEAAGKPTPFQLHKRSQLGAALAAIRLKASRNDNARQALLADLLHAAETHPLGIDGGALRTVQKLATRFVQRNTLSEILPNRFARGQHLVRLRTIKTVFPLQPDNIPAELTDIAQWVGYQLVPKEDGKTDKVPKNPYSGGNAGVTFPATWADFATALDFAYHAPDVDGVAIVLTADDPLVVVDIDECINADGTLTNAAQEVVTLLDSYTEVSPSGRGIHIFVKGELAGKRRRSQTRHRDVRRQPLYDRDWILLWQRANAGQRAHATASEIVRADLWR